MRPLPATPVARSSLRATSLAFSTAIATLLALGSAGAAYAQAPAYPTKPIRVIVPFTPGTGPDILSRTIGQRLGDEWKTAIVIDNRAGASGNIGTELVARSAPDGYTLLSTAITIVQNGSLFKTIPYDPIKDFTPVISLAAGRLALVTSRELPAKTVAEFLALAKARPGKLTYASPGNGTPHHLAMELLKAKTGIDVVHAPYKGTAGAVQDLLGGRIDVMFLPVHVALPYVEDGKLNMLAAGGTQRASATPKVPSLAEASGISGVDTDMWYAIYAPAGTSRDVVTRLNSTLNAMLKQPDVVDILAKQGLQPLGGTPEQLETLTRTDLERWGALVREAKIQAD